MQPDVSFLIAAYNAAGTIERAVRSALAQDGVSLEVIVADDASTDGTAGVVAAIGDPRIRMVRLVENRGPGGARNAGLAAATGRYVAILDSDDTVHPERMKRLVARLDESGAQAIVDGQEVRRADGSVTPMFTAGELDARSAITLPDYVRGNLIFESSFNFGYLKPVFERSFIVEHAVAYPEDIRIGEDYQFLATVLAQGGRCIVEPAIGYTYQITQGSVSRVLKLDHVRQIETGDRHFLARHRLDEAAAAAYAERGRNLARTAAFLTAVEALKRRDFMAAARAAARDPGAMRLFSLPIGKRLSRLLPAQAGAAGS